MKIQLLSGGLANQIRHYTFVRYAERSYPSDEWFFDDSWFWVHTDIPTGEYQLEKIFGLKLRLLSQYYNPNTWEEIVRVRKTGLSMPQVLLNMGIPIAAVEGKPYVLGPFTGVLRKTSGFEPEILTLPYENIYYHSFYGKNTWFMTYKAENLAELVFPEITDKKNLEYAEMIKNHMSVGIHIRKGDFADFGWDLPAKYYKEGCQKILAMYPDAWFFVFSDDLLWCEANAEELGLRLPVHVTYVSGNAGEKSYIDMKLLSLCRGIIRNAESSFSQVAGWMNQNLEFDMKLAPKNGFRTILPDWVFY